MLTAEATPACASLAAARTVDVSGATVSDSPSPNTAIAGSTVPMYVLVTSTRVSSARPVPATMGPTVMGRRGPMRWARRPALADRVSIRIVTGSRAAPASIGENPTAFCRTTGSRKIEPPSAA